MGSQTSTQLLCVDDVLDQLLRLQAETPRAFRRYVIGGGVLPGIAGMAAYLYRRAGVPLVRVPTTLLVIVDTRIGFNKNGVDCCRGTTDETYKNRVRSFYAPSCCS